MSNVLAFKDVVPPGEADPDIVTELEELLERAKSGDLRAYDIYS